jgi:hypothetical protein
MRETLKEAKVEYDEMEGVLDIYFKPADFKELLKKNKRKNRIIAVLNIG